MPTASDLLEQARNNRDIAQRLIELAPGMSLAIDRETFVKHAAFLEEEAVRLEAQANDSDR